jgi:hypothetical protein
MNSMAYNRSGVVPIFTQLNEAEKKRVRDAENVCRDRLQKNVRGKEIGTL